VWDAAFIDALAGVKIDFVGAGEKHSIAVSETGGIYAFGSGNTGALRQFPHFVSSLSLSPPLCFLPRSRFSYFYVYCLHVPETHSLTPAWADVSWCAFTRMQRE
jgi:hypothetical protein